MDYIVAYSWNADTKHMDLVYQKVCCFVWFFSVASTPDIFITNEFLEPCYCWGSFYSVMGFVHATLVTCPCFSSDNYTGHISGHV